jgi:hypothetical protein
MSNKRKGSILKEEIKEDTRGKRPGVVQMIGDDIIAEP